MFGRCCPAAPRPECPARQSPSWWSRRSAPRSRPRHSRGSRLGGSTRRSGRACGRWWRCWGAGRPAQRPSSACCSASRRPDSYRKTSGRTETAARAASRCWRRQCRTQSAGRRCRAGGCLPSPLGGVVPAADDGRGAERQLAPPDLDGDDAGAAAIRDAAGEQHQYPKDGQCD